MEYVSVNIVMLIVIIVSILLVEGYGGVMLIFLFIKGFVKCWKNFLFFMVVWIIFVRFKWFFVLLIKIWLNEWLNNWNLGIENEIGLEKVEFGYIWDSLECLKNFCNKVKLIGCVIEKDFVWL